MSELAILGPVGTERVHPMIERFHHGGNSVHAEGTFRVRRGRTPLARLVATIFRLPCEGREVPMALRIARDGDGEVWHRVIGGRFLRAWFHCGYDEAVERVGVLELRYDVRVEDGALRLRSRSSTLRFGAAALPLPRFICLRVGSRTWIRLGDSRMHVSVAVFLPVGGLLFAYHGSVTEVE